MSAFSTSTIDVLPEYYRCAPIGASFAPPTQLSADAGFFQTNRELRCFGRFAKRTADGQSPSGIADRQIHVGRDSERVNLPFVPREIIENLRMERYAAGGNGNRNNGLIRQVYYLIRPLLPVSLRKYLQRYSLRGWDQITFPQWPVDCTVDRLHEMLLVLAMQSQQICEIPFVWFWPDGRPACASVTHDIETATGRDFCSQLMDIDDSFDIKASFQVVPEERYEVTSEYLSSIRDRNFEVNIHDLNHDGNLFQSREQFLQRAESINQHGKEFQARGFRSAVLYRNLEWMDALDFKYDMSVPNVAHLDPQRGGCCTVMPYFIGEKLEIPVTAIQDYSLFHILADYSTRLWEQQIEIIKEAHGLASFIIHPDYVIEGRARSTYERLLAHLDSLRKDQNVWIALPGEINDWWRSRAKMRVRRVTGTWQVEGEGSERARVAFASVENDQIRYRIQ